MLRISSTVTSRRIAAICSTILLLSFCLQVQTYASSAKSGSSGQSGTTATTQARQDDNSAEWAKMLAKLTGASSASTSGKAQPAAERAPAKTAAAAKPAAAGKAPVKAKTAQDEEWGKALNVLGGGTPASPTPVTSPPVERPAAVPVRTEAKPKAAAAVPVATTAVSKTVPVTQETPTVQPEATTVAPVPVSAPAAVAPAPAPEKVKAPPASAPAPAGKTEAKPAAASAAAPIPPKSGGQAEAKSKVAGAGPVRMWFEIQTATMSARYRYVDNSSGVMTNSQLQHNEAFKGRLKFGPKGSYSFNAGVASGNNFTGGWNNTGVGTGVGYSNVFLKQLFFEAKPGAGIEAQYGGLAFNRGESTEITSYDNDAYLVGQRLSLKRPKTFFFDEITATYGYLGDLSKPSVTKRFFRLKESNYHQFLVVKKLGKRGSFSADYTFASGVETLRQAVKLNVKESHLLDSILYENYQRVDFKPDYGFALYGEKTLRKRYTFGGGYASIDRDYGGLNADRFNKGNRVYFSSKFVLTPEFSVSTFVTRAVSNGFAIANRTRLDIIFTYDLLKSLQGTGIF